MFAAGVSNLLTGSESLNQFERSLPELQPREPTVLSNVSQRVPEAFRRHYVEFATRRDRDALKKRSLYSVDDVVADDRFSSIVSVVARSSASRPSFPEPDLSGWHTEHDLEDRAAVVESVVAFLDGLKVESAAEHAEAYGILLDLAPEFLKEFTRRDGLAVERFFREAVTRAGESRVDRPTIPLVGPLFTRENNRRVADALAYAAKANVLRPEALLWLIPEVAWGMTRVLPLTLEMIRRHIRGTDTEAQGVQAIAILRARERHIAEAFTAVETRVRSLPGSLELLLLPGMLVAVLVHAPIRAQTAFPVPLGIMSFDQRVVSRAQDFLRKRLPNGDEREPSPVDYQRILSEPKRPES